MKKWLNNRLLSIIYYTHIFEAATFVPHPQESSRPITRSSPLILALIGPVSSSSFHTAPPRGNRVVNL